MKLVAATRFYNLFIKLQNINQQQLLAKYLCSISKLIPEIIENIFKRIRLNDETRDETQVFRSCHDQLIFQGRYRKDAEIYTLLLNDPFVMHVRFQSTVSLHF